MSTWNNLILHPHFERIKAVYNDQFPIEVRFICANWIERRMNAELIVDINHPQIKEMATIFLRELIQQLKHEKHQLKRAEQLSIQFRLDAAIETFTKHLLHPFAVYKQIRDTISYEGHLLGMTSCVDEEAIEITQKLNILKNEVLTNKEKQKNYKHDIENYKVLEYRETVTQLIEVNNALEQERRLAILDDHQRKKFQFIEIINVRSANLKQSLANQIQQIDSVQKLIFNRLNRWHRDQALAGNGAPLNKNALDEIQLWFEKLAEIIWTTRCCIEAMREINNSISSETCGVIAQAHTDVTTLLTNLIEAAFIVEMQPPQVLKTEVNFTATVRLLTANLGIQFNNSSSVVVSIFAATQHKATEHNATQHSATQHKLKHQNREILNNTGKLDIQPSTHHLSCTFSNMKLMKFKRTEKKKLPFVTDKKYALIFESTFRTADISINVSVKTLPVVIVVHTYQEPQSWATIFWDNAFSQICREPFHVTDTVNWSQLIGALNIKFTAETGRCLTADGFQYLFEKVFGTGVVDEDRPISWTQFCRALLPDRTFSFWDWFYSVMKLIRNYVHVAWTDGFIIGFIDKRQTVEKLRHSPVGTFLVRFSESELGGICIAWVHQTTPLRVEMLKPFFGKDIEILSLDRRIGDLHQFVTLYPNIPKGLAFKQSCSSTIKSDNGCVMPVLKFTIPDPDGNSTDCSCKKLFLELQNYPAESFDFLSCS